MGERTNLHHLPRRTSSQSLAKILYTSDANSDNCRNAGKDSVMPLINEYKLSQSEEDLFLAIGMEAEIMFCIKGHVNPYQLYQWAVNKCFLGDIQGPAVESLKRCFALFGEGKEHRLTPEWDELIQLEDEKSTFSDGSPIPAAPGPLHYEPSIETKKENS